MAIPDHVKKQAMDAVAHKETTAQIRLYSNNHVPAPTFSELKVTPVTPGAIPDHVKKQAMDAIANKETTAQIRLVRDNGSMSPGPTPAHETSKVAEKVAGLHKTGQQPDSVQQAMAKDTFERDYYG
jgi:hypothetical protein